MERVKAIEHIRSSSHLVWSSKRGDAYIECRRCNNGVNFILVEDVRLEGYSIYYELLEMDNQKIVDDFNKRASIV